MDLLAEIVMTGSPRVESHNTNQYRSHARLQHGDFPQACYYTVPNSTVTPKSHVHILYKEQTGSALAHGATVQQRN